VVAVTALAMAVVVLLGDCMALDRLEVRFVGVHRVLTHKYYVA